MYESRLKFFNNAISIVYSFRNITYRFGNDICYGIQLSCMNIPGISSTSLKARARERLELKLRKWLKKHVITLLQKKRICVNSVYIFFHILIPCILYNIVLPGNLIIDLLELMIACLNYVFRGRFRIVVWCWLAEAW